MSVSSNRDATRSSVFTHPSELMVFTSLLPSRSSQLRPSMLRFAASTPVCRPALMAPTVSPSRLRRSFRSSPRRIGIAVRGLHQPRCFETAPPIRAPGAQCARVVPRGGLIKTSSRRFASAARRFVPLLTEEGLGEEPLCGREWMARQGFPSSRKAPPPTPPRTRGGMRTTNARFAIYLILHIICPFLSAQPRGGRHTCSVAARA